ncbi:MAG TPA: hypothetical protein VGN16_02425 [Acidobacteriaceae bacterium]
MFRRVGSAAVVCLSMSMHAARFYPSVAQHGTTEQHRTTAHYRTTTQRGTTVQRQVLDEPPAMQIAVLYFVASDCLYSDRYFPEMERLRRQFESTKIGFRWIYPDQGEQLANVQAHQKQFGAPSGSARLDADGAITRLAQTHITPEAAVLVRAQDGSWRTVYHGRIDDRYVRLGLERPHAQRHDLQDAIRAAIDGKPAPPADGSAVGCAILGPSQ